MTTPLSIAALGILLLVIAGVSRLVRRERPEGAGSRFLPSLVTLFLIIFAAVSLSVVSQLAEDSSGTAKLALLFFLIVNAILCGVSWTSTEAY